jgi:hypothetical protein
MATLTFGMQSHGLYDLCDFQSVNVLGDVDSNFYITPSVRKYARLYESLIEKDVGLIKDALNYLHGIEQFDKAVSCTDDTYHARQHYIDLALYFDAIPHPDLVGNNQSDYEATSEIELFVD